MSDPFVGEIRQVGFDYAPPGWAMCDGSLLNMHENTLLFAVVGTQFGGDGKSTFALPDLRGRFAVGAGQGPGLSPYSAGETGGAATVTLTDSEMPGHTHIPQASSALGDRESPDGATWAQPHFGRSSQAAYAAGVAATPMAATAIALEGGDQPHNNLPPYQALNFIIALQGIVPPRS